MHVVAHEGCINTVRESALKVDSERTIPCRTRESNPRPYCSWLFGPMFHPLSYIATPKPWSVCLSVMFVSQ